MEMVNCEPASDPGRSWRRILRSSFLVFVALLLFTQYMEDTSVLDEIKNQARWAWSEPVMKTFGQRATMAEWLFVIYNCSFLSLYLTTPLLLLIAIPRQQQHSAAFWTANG